MDYTKIPIGEKADLGGDVFLIRLALYEDNSVCWAGFFHDSGEPVEFDTLEEAKTGVEPIKSGECLGSLFEAWDSSSSERPTVGSVEIKKVTSVS